LGDTIVGVVSVTTPMRPSFLPDGVLRIWYGGRIGRPVFFERTFAAR
jgi:hypothetical protein